MNDILAARLRWFFAAALTVVLAILGSACTVVAFGVLSFAWLSEWGRVTATGIQWLGWGAGILAVAGGLSLVAARAHVLLLRRERADVKSIVLELPKGADRRSLEYSRQCFEDCARRGELPEARHILDSRMGVGSDALVTVVYVDLGVSSSMRVGMDLAAQEGRYVEFRRLSGWPTLHADSV